MTSTTLQETQLIGTILHDDTDKQQQKSNKQTNPPQTSTTASVSLQTQQQVNFQQLTRVQLAQQQGRPASAPPSVHIRSDNVSFSCDFPSPTWSIFHFNNLIHF
jgi:hypothetical protein